MGQKEDHSEDQEMLWIHLYDMQLTELTSTLQMGFQSLWEVLVVMVVLWRPCTVLSYQSKCGSMLGFPSWTNCCPLCCFWLLCFSLLLSYPGIGIYSPNYLALRVSEPPFVSLSLCIFQVTNMSPCWVDSVWGCYGCCSMLGCLRTNQKCPGLPFLFPIVLYCFW